MSRRNTITIFCFVLFVLSLAVPSLSAQEDNVDIYGRTLPDDAAPYELQVWQEMCRSDTTQITFMAAIAVYQRICEPGLEDKFGDSLVNLDENLNLAPAAAESWEPSEDGLTWTFHLRPDQVWSDGTPLTANDWVATWHWMATPENAYDFVWMWQGIIEGWSEAVAGEIPPEEIGMEAIDDLTLAVRTVSPAPYLPGTLYFWPPLQAKALAELGPNYVNDPATSVSSGPFILREFVPGERAVLEANPTYNGYRKPYLRELRGLYGDKANGLFLAFQNHDVDRAMYEFLTPADFEVITADPVLLDHYLPNPGDFRTDYLLFDTFNPPFDDRNVRLAFAKAVDREAIVANVINATFQLAIPAYSFLAPGYPASDTNGDLHDIQAYDCEAAQALLAEAGYANGEGFPAQELKLRDESEFNSQRFIAAAASISECLNVEITVNNMDYATYMDGLLARPTAVQFGAVSYGMDYIDPSNMMGVWVSTGRHSWRNAEFDELVLAANSFVGNPEERIQMYQDAERILVEDVGGIFLDHRIQGDLFQPYVAGDCFRPNAQGVSAFQWGNAWCWGSLYITDEVADFDTYRTR
jgi:peptide/nickel transport system substrate-binding protein/oligopeptide transport system substrate-binding protein